MTTLLLFGAGLAALVVGTQLPVRGASKRAPSFGISPLGVSPCVIGTATIGRLTWRGGYPSPRG
jgi:cation:H+ antiporter